MQLHVEFLQVFVLFEPNSAGVVFYVDLGYLFYYLFYLFLVKNVAYSLHFNLKIIKF